MHLLSFFFLLYKRSLDCGGHWPFMGLHNIGFEPKIKGMLVVSHFFSKKLI